jgi:hypothetical protein
MIKKKEEVIHKFSNAQLEDLLNNSTKNVAQEVVSCLIPKKGEGVLILFDGGHPATSNPSAREVKPISKVLEQTEQRRASLHQRSNS